MESGVRGNSARWVKNVVSNALTLEKAAARRVNVLITDNRRIRKINKRFLAHDYATDVISFGAGNGRLAREDRDYLGDIVVSAQMARSVARELGIPFKEELGRYLVHGILHLLGYDDQSERKRSRMRRRQEEILRLCSIKTSSKA